MMAGSGAADREAERRERSQLAHDLRNPMAVVVGRIQLIRRRLRRGEVDALRLTTELEAVEAAMVRMVAIIDRLDAEPDEPSSASRDEGGIDRGSQTIEIERLGDDRNAQRGEPGMQTFGCPHIPGDEDDRERGRRRFRS